MALSGGPDSTALLIWLAEAGRAPVAAHFDHALRPGSAQDAAHVGALCARWGVPLIAGRRASPLAAGSLQAAARAARYDFLKSALAVSGCQLVALGHTADDLVEGVLLHLLRGSALAGLRGMPSRRGPFWRPFLGVWRAELERFLDARGESALRDPANADTARFARARVRLHLLPALERARPGLTARLARVAGRAAALTAELEAAAADRMRSGRTADLRAAPRVVRYEAYRRLYGSPTGLGRRHLAAIDRLVLEGGSGRGIDLPGKKRFQLAPGRVSIDVTTPALKPPADPVLVTRECGGCPDPGAVHLRPGFELSVGHRRPGLRMRPLGGPGSRKLQDLLVDAKVPRDLRDRLPLVFAGDRLAWVPGIAVDALLAAAPGDSALHVTLEGWPSGGGSIWPTHPRRPAS